MSGASYTFTLEDAEARRLFSRLRDAVRRNAAPLYVEIGSVLEDSTRERYRTETGPDGIPWAPISKEWRDEKKELGFNTGIKKMRGDLLNSVAFESDAHSTTVIESQPYAAIHHYGGEIRPKKGRALLVRGRFVSRIVMPARPSLGISDDDREEIADATQDFLRRVAAG